MGRILDEFEKGVVLKILSHLMLDDFSYHAQVSQILYPAQSKKRSPALVSEEQQNQLSRLLVRVWNKRKVVLPPAAKGEIQWVTNLANSIHNTFNEQAHITMRIRPDQCIEILVKGIACLVDGHDDVYSSRVVWNGSGWERTWQQSPFETDKSYQLYEGENPFKRAMDCAVLFANTRKTKNGFGLNSTKSELKNKTAPFSLEVRADHRKHYATQLAKQCLLAISERKVAFA